MLHVASHVVRCTSGQSTTTFTSAAKPAAPHSHIRKRRPKCRRANFRSMQSLPHRHVLLPCTPFRPVPPPSVSKVLRTLGCFCGPAGFCAGPGGGCCSVYLHDSVGQGSVPPVHTRPHTPARPRPPARARPPARPPARPRRKALRCTSERSWRARPSLPSGSLIRCDTGGPTAAAAAPPSAAAVFGGAAAVVAWRGLGSVKKKRPLHGARCRLCCRRGIRQPPRKRSGTSERSSSARRFW